MLFHLARTLFSLEYHLTWAFLHLISALPPIYTCLSSTHLTFNFPVAFSAITKHPILSCHRIYPTVYLRSVLFSIRNLVSNIILDIIDIRYSKSIPFVSELEHVLKWHFPICEKDAIDSGRCTDIALKNINSHGKKLISSTIIFSLLMHQ